MLFWDNSWTDEDFEMKVSKAIAEARKMRQSIFARYTADQKRIEELEGVIEDLVSYRVDRSQAMGEF